MADEYYPSDDGELDDLTSIFGERESSEFVGREEQLNLFESNLRLRPRDRHYFIFNIHGQGGMGKSTLLTQFEQQAQALGALTTRVDEDQNGLLPVLSRMVEQLKAQGIDVKDFEAEYQRYLHHIHKLEQEPDFPTGLVKMAVRGSVIGTLRVAKTALPFGQLLSLLGDEKDVAASATEFAEYVYRKVTDKKVADLLIDPIQALTSLLVSILREKTDHRPLALFFDTYEVTSIYLDPWLRALLPKAGKPGEYGNLPGNIVLAIAGRKPLDRNLWNPYARRVASIELNPFTETEAVQFLHSRSITDPAMVAAILKLSGGVPLFLDMLTHNTPQNLEDLPDTTDAAIHRYLQGVDPAQEQFVLSSALLRRFNRDTVTEIATVLAIEEKQVPSLFDALIAHTFIKRLDKGWVFHQLVRTPMLRRKQDESPREWREIHTRLMNYFLRQRDALHLNDIEGVNNEQWRELTLELVYHSLCAVSEKALPLALNTFLNALGNLDYARGCAETLRQAGEDCENQQLENWGNLLVAGLRAYQQENYSQAVSMFTALVNFTSIETAQQATALAWRGHIYTNLMLKEEALADFTAAIAKSPRFTWAIASRADVLRLMGRYQEAISGADLALRLLPDYTLALAIRGVAYHEIGETHRALDDLNRAIELSPNYAFALGHRVKVHEALQDFEAALKDVLALEALEPENLAYLFIHLRLLTRMKHYDQQTAYLQELNRAVPRYLEMINASLIRELGKSGPRPNVHMDVLPMVEKLWAFFKQKIESHPSEMIEILRLGLIGYQAYLFAFNGDLDLSNQMLEGARFWSRIPAALGVLVEDMPVEAFQAFSQTADLTPIQTRELEVQLAQVYQRVCCDNQQAESIARGMWVLVQSAALYTGGHHTEALTCAQTMPLGDEPFLMLLMRALLFQAIGEHHLAAEDFNHALDLNPASNLALTARAELLMELGPTPEIMADLDRILEADPDYDWALQNRAKFRSDLGDIEGAIADYTRLIEQDDTDSFILANRGYLYEKSGEVQKALADYNRAAEVDPDYAWVFRARGSLHISLGDYEKAVQDLTRAMQLNPDDLYPVERRAEAYLALRRFYEALVDLNDIISRSPVEDWLYYCRALVYLNTPGSEQLARQDLTLAIETAQSRMQMDPQAWRTAFNLALYHLAAGQLEAQQAEEAAAQYRQLLSQNPPAGAVEEALRDLDDYLWFFNPQEGDPEAYHLIEANKLREALAQAVEETESPEG